jgi:hypothetical protein
MESSALQTILIVVLGLSGTIILTVVLVNFATRALKKKLEPLRAELGGEIQSGLSGTYLRLSDADVETRIVLVPAGKSTPPRLILQRMRVLPFPLNVYRENFATRGLSKWGLMQDIKSGDAEFDRKYVIRSSETLRAQNFFQDATNRENVDRFFDSGFDYFRVDKKSSSAGKPNYIAEDLEPARIREYLGSLNELVG